MAPHARDPAEMEAQIDAIVRRAIAELRALDPGCDCAVLHGVGSMLALALDERVIFERDAFAALDLVAFLARAQQSRRETFGLDEVTVDGPIDLRAAQGGPLVARVTVRLGGRLLEVSEAMETLDALRDAAPEGNDVQ